MKRKTSEVLIFTTIAEALGRPHRFWLKLFSVLWQVSRSTAIAGLEREVKITFPSYLHSFGVIFYIILLMSPVLLNCVFLTVDFWCAYVKTVNRFPVPHIYWKYFIIYIFSVYWLLPTGNWFKKIRKFLWSNPASIQYALKVISIVAAVSCRKNCIHLFNTIFLLFLLCFLVEIVLFVSFRPRNTGAEQFFSSF